MNPNKINMKILTPKQYRCATWMGIGIYIVVFPVIYNIASFACYSLSYCVPGWFFHSYISSDGFFSSLNKRIFDDTAGIISIVLFLYGIFLLVKSKENRRKIIISIIINIFILVFSVLLVHAVVTSGGMESRYNFLGN